MKKNYQTILILFSVICLVVTGGLFLPGFFLNTSAERLSDHLQAVPSDYYMSSGSAILEVASLQLSEYEKIRLISGAWDSENNSVSTDQMENNAYTMVKTAKDNLKKMYLSDLYPTSFSKIGSNWYTWNAECFSSTDSTFHTYTAFYWLITLTKFDNTEKHTILITEDGTILYAEAVIPTSNKSLAKVARNYRKLPYAESKLCSFTELSKYTVSPSYPNVKFSSPTNFPGVMTINSEWIKDQETLDKCYKMAPDLLEFYYLFQHDEINNGVEHYTIGMIPYEGPNNVP